MIEQPRGGDFEPPLPPFLGEPVGHFIQGGTAEVANTSTCASSAVRNIPPPSAKTKTPICEQIPLSPEHQFQLSLRGNSLVTPVRVDRFEQLLAGYDPTLKQLDKFNGRVFCLLERWDTSSTLELYTDAAASKRYEAICGKHWFYGPFPIAWHSLNISFLELFPITLAVHIWGATMANSCVLFFTDNAALVDIINKQTSKHKQVMILIRDLVLSCLKYNILFRASHVPGLQNSRADCISRLQVEKFKELSPEADEFPTAVPTNLQPESWSLT